MPHKRSGSVTEAETSKDGPTAASIRRERKRAIDRESQRLSRARTRAYISQLEQTIEELQNSSARPQANSASVESSSVSISQLKQQCEENRKLKAMIGRIHRMTQEVASSSCDPVPEPAANDSPSNDALESTHAVSESSGSPALDEEVSPQESGTDHADVPSPFDFRGQAAISSMDENLGGNPWHIALASITQDTGLLKNHFEEIEGHFNQLELSDPAAPYSGAEEDDDIVIRACLFGWDEAKRRHRLDHVWIGIESLDQAVFFRARPVERVACLRMLRLMLIRKISPFGQLPRRAPHFMNPTKVQNSVEHASLIDYFVWPDLRDALVLANAQFASDLSTAWFATHIRLDWKYRAQDICKLNVARDLYSLSADFENTFGDLRAWVSPFGIHDLHSNRTINETFGIGLQPMDLQHGLTVC